jgi:hypothetical protein
MRIGTDTTSPLAKVVECLADTSFWPMLLQSSAIFGLPARATGLSSRPIADGQRIHGRTDFKRTGGGL